MAAPSPLELSNTTVSTLVLVVAARAATVFTNDKRLLQVKIKDRALGMFEKAPVSVDDKRSMLRKDSVVMLEPRIPSNMAAVIFTSFVVSRDSFKSSTSSRGRRPYSAGMVASPMALRDNTRSCLVCATNSVGYDVSGSPLIVNTRSDCSPTKVSELKHSMLL
ncbi:hypothetical protein LSAT2_009303 [Lamellibrachia satsuma]|nr:hypothetical protein LSAT2_009303 [Lamellibrachia satsuma]